MRLLTLRRWPSLISMTSSVGTRTSKIWSCMSIDSTRLRRFARTFSSWPEYACTTYQRASLAETAALLTAMFILPRRLRGHSWCHGRGRCCYDGGGCRRRRRCRGAHLLGDRLLDTEAQQIVCATHERGEDDHRRDHDAGHAQQFVPSGPDDLLQLFPDTTQVADRASPSGCGDREDRPRWPRTTRGASSLGH